MRRLWMLYLTLGLAATQGCHKTLQHTSGVCDCYAPPVESLLVAPSPSPNGLHVGASSYAPAPSYPLPSGNAILRNNSATTTLPRSAGAVINGAAPLPSAPASPVTPATPMVQVEKSTTNLSVSEPIRSLPTIVEKK